MSGILIFGIEDQSLKRAKKALKEADYEVYSCDESDVTRVYEEALKRRPDLILLDFTLPRDPVIQSIFRKFKKDRFFKETPIFAILPEDGIRLLDGLPGLEDFISAPFSGAEFLARVKAILKKALSTDSNDLIKTGDLVIDVNKYEVLLNGNKVELTFKEYELLKFLSSNKGRVYSRDQLLDKIWGYDYYGGTRTVDVHIRRLRSKIEDKKHVFIATIRNIGYKFIA